MTSMSMISARTLWFLFKQQQRVLACRAGWNGEVSTHQWLGKASCARHVRAISGNLSIFRSVSRMAALPQMHRCALPGPNALILAARPPVWSSSPQKSGLKNKVQIPATRGSVKSLNIHRARASAVAKNKKTNKKRRSLARAHLGSFAAPPVALHCMSSTLKLDSKDRKRSFIPPPLSSPRLTPSAVPMWPANELNGVRLACCALPLFVRCRCPIGRHGTRGFWQAKSLPWRGPIAKAQTQTWTVHAQGDRGWGVCTPRCSPTSTESAKAGCYFSSSSLLIKDEDQLNPNNLGFYPMPLQLCHLLIGKDEDARRVCDWNVEVGWMAQLWRARGGLFLNCTQFRRFTQKHHFDRITVKCGRRTCRITERPPCAVSSVPSLHNKRKIF